MSVGRGMPFANPTRYPWKKAPVSACGGEIPPVEPRYGVLFRNSNVPHDFRTLSELIETPSGLYAGGRQTGGSRHHNRSLKRSQSAEQWCFSTVLFGNRLAICGIPAQPEAVCRAPAPVTPSPQPESEQPGVVTPGFFVPLLKSPAE